MDVSPYVRPKTSKSSENHRRPGLWAGRVDHHLVLTLSSMQSMTTVGYLRVNQRKKAGTPMVLGLWDKGIQPGKINNWTQYQDISLVYWVLETWQRTCG